jgi:hypothetical protein
MMNRRWLVGAFLVALAMPLALGCSKPKDTPATDLNRKIVPPAGVAGESGKQQAPQKALKPES